MTTSLHPSSRRKPGSIDPRNDCLTLRALTKVWVPAFAGMTEKIGIAL